MVGRTAKLRSQKERRQFFDLEVELTRKAIKNSYIRVSAPDGLVKMSVPLRASEHHVIGMLEDKYSWIVDRQIAIQRHVWPEPTRLLTGEPHELWGRSHRLEVVEHKVFAGARLLLDDSLELSVPIGSGRDERTRVLEEFYRNELKTAAGPLIDKWSRIMDVDVGEWRIKKMRTRWGTCNVTDRRVWLSLMLAKRSPACLENIVVHELAHLIERAHSKRFWSLMDQFLPEWRESELELNSAQPTFA